MEDSERKKLSEKLRGVAGIGNALRLVIKSSPGLVLGNLVCQLIQGLLPLLLLFLIKLLVDEVAVSIEESTGYGAFSQVAGYIVFIGLLLLLQTIISSIGNLISENQSHLLADHVQSLIHNKSLELDLSIYEDAEYYNSLHRAQSEGAYRAESIVSNLGLTIQSGVTLLTLTGLLITFHPLLAIALFASVVPGILIRLHHSGKLFHWQRQQTENIRKADYYDWILTGLEYVKEVRLFGFGKFFKSRYENIRKEMREGKVKISTARLKSETLGQVVVVLTVIAATGWIAYRAVNGQITLGDMIMFYQAFQRGLSTFQELAGSLSSIYEDNMFLKDFYFFLSMKPKLIPSETNDPVPQNITHSICFDHVSFKYPLSKYTSIDDINLTIHPGEITALTGANGSGKTTLMKLLCRFYDPDSGSITVDGVDIRNFNLTSWQRSLSAVFQDYVRYNLTAGENIRLGKLDDSDCEERIVKAAVNSGADTAIDNLPQGYETQLGKWFSEGSELSGGEWQQLAIARALFRDGLILILDEPTSSLDSAKENDLISMLKKLAADAPIILISHRLSTIRHADRIVVLANGRIVESGTYRELIQSGGAFARMAHAQTGAPDGTADVP